MKREDEKPCELCGTMSEIARHAFTYYCYCPVCGDYAYNEIPEFLPGRDDFNLLAKRKIATVLFENKLKIQSSLPYGKYSEKHQFLVSSGTIPEHDEQFTYFSFIELLERYPKSGNELFDRVLLNLNRIITPYSPLSPCIIDQPGYLAVLFIAGCNVNDMLHQLIVISEEMTALGYIKSSFRRDTIKKQYFPEKGIFSPALHFEISAKGWERINFLKNHSSGMNPQAFIAMPFDERTDELCKKAIEPAIKTAHAPICEVTPKCIKYKEHNEKICDEIMAEIRKSNYLVVDVTNSNPGAYYEAGFAQGLGLPVIWIVSKEYFDAQTKDKKIHFDTRQYNHVIYESTDDLFTKLKARIAGSISIDLILPPSHV